MRVHAVHPWYGANGERDTKKGELRRHVTRATGAWLVTPPIFVLAVAMVAIYLCGRAVAMGITRSQCVLRRPLLIMGFWAAVAAADATWLLVMR